MEGNKAKVIFILTNDIHDGATNIYEALMEDQKEEASLLIDQTVAQLRQLKKDMIND